MAQNPYVSKVEYAGQTLLDLTEDTATPSDVLNGKTFHDRSGAPQTGNLITNNVKHDQFQGTANANGYIVSTIPSSTKIISAYAQDYPCVPLTYRGYWYFMIFYPSNGTMIPRPNASATVHYYYIE